MNLVARVEVPSSARSEAVLARLIKLHPKLIDLSLDRLRRLLHKLGNPERNLPPVLHVAGTNGKGSTISFIRSVLEASGKRVHVFSSPHLIRFNERIRLSGNLIDDDSLVSVLRACEDANGCDPITFFEVTTAAAFLAFRDSPADILLLETGLGGRLDATNVVDSPLLTAITTISIDHEEFLGDSIAKIATEKAGIMKQGVNCVVGRQVVEAAEVIQEHAKRSDIALIKQGREWQVGVRKGKLIYQSNAGILSLPIPALNGSYQIQNAGVALACIENLTQFPVSDKEMAIGLSRAKWDGRLQRLSSGPFFDKVNSRFGPKSELWLDGGHNPGAGEALAETLAVWRAQDSTHKPLHLIVAMQKQKDAVNFFAPFRNLTPHLHAVVVPHESNSMTQRELKYAATSQGLKVSSAECIMQALSYIVNNKKETLPPRILICGSLYLAGSVLATNPQKNTDLN